MLLNNRYPTPPMSAVPTILLEAFLASKALDDTDYGGKEIDHPDVQRVFALHEGAKSRARESGMLESHDTQAAAMLVILEDLDLLMSGSLTIGGERAFQEKLDHDELHVLHLLKDTLLKLLAWHFRNGAGALLPVADWMGLVAKDSTK